MTEVAWDLGQLYSSVDDPRIKETMEDIRARVSDFCNKYQNKLLDTSPSQLSVIIKELEEISLLRRQVGQFARLTYVAKQSLAENKKLNENAQNFSMEIGRQLAFFSVDLGTLLLAKPHYINDAELSNYRHYLEKSLRRAPHNLSEIEEKLSISLNKNGINAWQEFQGSHLGTLSFDIEIKGEVQSHGFGGFLGFLNHDDKSVRRQAHEEMFGKLKNNSEIFANILRNISSFHVINSDLRNYKDTLDSSMIMNDVERPMFDGLSKAVMDGRLLFQKFLRTKAKMMGVDVLDPEDISAPVSGLPDMTFTWEEAKDLVTEAYTRFDPEFGKMIASMFDKNNIDASPRKGKRQGAFCSGWPIGKSAFILMSFTGTLTSVFTLAHELGHAAQAILNENQESLFNQSYPMVIAEVASEFGEMMLVNLLLERAKSDDEKKAVLLGLLDNFGQSIFQVFSRTNFEHETYKAVQNGEFLDDKTFARLWSEARNEMHGDTVNWFETMDFDMWTWKPHPYMPYFRYYNYPYTWSQLMVLALYESYENNPQEFIPKFRAMLADGGKKSPKELATDMGFDLADSEFWKLGMVQYEKIINQLEELL
jgi:oligoendopeptidase F